MSKRTRVLAAGAIVLALVASFNLSADEKTARENIAKLAVALEKNDTQAIKSLTESLKKENLDDVMNLFRLRKSGGFGVGNMPSAITPDGIDLKFTNLGKKTVAGDLKTQGDAIAEAAYRAAAIMEIAIHKCPITKKEKDKDPKDWDKWSKAARDASLELAKAAKAKDAKKVEDAAKKVNNNCQQCHGTFRD